ncbi:MAG: hypothetical protein SGI71_11795 [Verrucomicrobiota bacterium]|nr:hypothetical protein [Verrucomicrobiota bacterium]
MLDPKNCEMVQVLMNLTVPKPGPEIIQQIRQLKNVFMGLYDWDSRSAFALIRLQKLRAIRI